eukprot:105824-Chlamydomonas_euryale.AAC.3
MPAIPVTTSQLTLLHECHREHIVVFDFQIRQLLRVLEHGCLFQQLLPLGRLDGRMGQQTEHVQAVSDVAIARSLARRLRKPSTRERSATRS